MTTYITLAGAVVYIALVAVSIWTTKRRPALTARVWGSALPLAAVLAGLNFIAAEWLTGGIWTFSAAVCAFGGATARRRQQEREIDKFWAERFQS